MISKVTALHLQRRAVIYIRQSTIKQVVEHSESTKRQYDLKERAIALGWRREAIEVVDEDLGRSGTTTEGRTGFQKLSEEVAHGGIGAIFALDVSRFARSSADWHRLLDLCGLADVVIADEQAVYDPGDHNDRLLLGIKGTMSEAELMWMKLRLRGARLSKARRGEHFLPPPIGYEWDPIIAGLRLDPDQEVQCAVRLLFERFRIEQSAYGVARYFIVHDVKVPARRAGHRDLTWSAPRPSRILAILHNPTYAGSYVYGRRQLTTTLADGKIVHRSRRIPVDGWKIVLSDRHPAYITWQRFLENQEMLTKNRPHRDFPERHGAALQGKALLQGILLCGRCGHRMSAVVCGSPGRGRYICLTPLKQGKTARICWSVSAAAIDAQIERAVLSVVQPPEIELALAVARETERQSGKRATQWRMSLERARYEARLAERRYKAVDPDNRVVARTLEHDWEQKLGDLQELEHRFQRACKRQKVALTGRDRARILSLARDIPRVWEASTTTMSDKKNIVRALVGEVCLTPLDAANGGTRIEVLWRTGATSKFEVPKQLPGRRTSGPAADLISKLVRRGTPATEIADILNERGISTASGRRWTNLTVHGYSRYHGIRWPSRMPTSVRCPAQRRDGLFSMHGVAEKLSVTTNAVQYWVQRRWLKPVAGERARGRPRWFRLDDLTIRRLEKVRDAHTRSDSRRRPEVLRVANSSRKRSARRSNKSR